MSVTSIQFKELAKEFETGSWAIWSPRFNMKGCHEEEPMRLRNYLESKIGMMRNSVILLGLNRSLKRTRSGKIHRRKYASLSNFHAVGHAGDGLLKEVISSLSNVRGGYMTDLSLARESNSSRVKVNEREALRRLERQLDILNAEQYDVICFGKTTFKALAGKHYAVKQLVEDDVSKVELALNGGYHLSCYGAIHYSYAARWNKKARFVKQMERINQLIGKSNRA